MCERFDKDQFDALCDLMQEPEILETMREAAASDSASATAIVEEDILEEAIIVPLENLDLDVDNASESDNTDITPFNVDVDHDAKVLAYVAGEILKTAKTVMERDIDKSRKSQDSFREAEANYNGLMAKAYQDTTQANFINMLSTANFLKSQKLSMIAHLPEGLEDFLEDRCDDELNHFLGETFSSKRQAYVDVKDHQYYFYAFLRRLLSQERQEMTLSEEIKMAIKDEVLIERL